MSEKTALEKALNKNDLLEVRKLVNRFSNRELAMYCIAYLKDRDKLLAEIDQYEKMLRDCKREMKSYGNGCPSGNGGWWHW